MGGDVSVDEVHRWAGGLDEMHARFGRYFAGRNRVNGQGSLCGLLAPLERKNGWTLAEQAGEGCPDGMQRLLNRADWDADAVRDEVRGFVLEHLGAEDAVLIVDETGFIKKGVRSAGVQRQYTGLWEDRQLSAGGVPRLRFRQGAGVDRPGAVPADPLD